MKPGDFGTDADGGMSEEYCKFCFRDGRFTEPGITMQEMIEKVAGFMVTLEKMPEKGAKRLAKSFVPELKRWK